MEVLKLAKQGQAPAAVVISSVVDKPAAGVAPQAADGSSPQSAGGSTSPQRSRRTSPALKAVAVAGRTSPTSTSPGTGRKDSNSHTLDDHTDTGKRKVRQKGAG